MIIEKLKKLSRESKNEIVSNWALHLAEEFEQEYEYLGCGDEVLFDIAVDRLIHEASDSVAKTIINFIK